MNTHVQTANESAVGAASLEKPLAFNSPPTDLHALGFRLYHKRVTFSPAVCWRHLRSIPPMACSRGQGAIM